MIITRFKVSAVARSFRVGDGSFIRSVISVMMDRNTFRVDDAVARQQNIGGQDGVDPVVFKVSSKKPTFSNKS